MRGRRVALLLTGVLPLLAKDDVPATDNNVVVMEEEIENDISSQQRGAAEKLHDDVLSSLPRLPFDLTNIVSASSRILMVDRYWEDELEFLKINTTAHQGLCMLEHSNVTSTHDRTPPEQLHEETEQEREEDGMKDIEGNEITEENRDSEGDDAATGAASDSQKEGTTVSALAEAVEEETHAEEKEDIQSQEENKDDVNVDEAVKDPSTTQSKESETDVETETDSEEKHDEEEEDSQAKRVQVDYASKSAGAQMLESSPAMKGASNLLTNDNDKYAITPCSEKKYVVVGLSEDILVKQIRIANYERYSSHVKDFQVLGSQTMGQWVDLGTFTAKIGNGSQEFELEEPAWARYLKFKFLTHHRDEHYCTLSQIKVHGSTMLQGFHEQFTDDGEEQVEGEGDANEETVDASKTADDSETVEEDAKAADDQLEGSQTVGTEVESKSDASVAAESSGEQEGVVDDTQPNSTKEDVVAEGASVDDHNHSTTMKPLPPIFDIYAAQIPFSLEHTRFDLPSHKSINEIRRQKTEALDLTAIATDANGHDFSNSISNSNTQDFGNAVKDAVKGAVQAVVAEASDTVQKVKDASAVTDAVRELQSRIQTTIGMTWELQHSIHTMIGKTLPGLNDHWVEDETEAAVSSEIAAEEATTTDEGVGVKSESPPVAQSVKEETAQNEKSDAAEEKPPPTTVVEETTLDLDLTAGLADVINQYPSAKCLESLNFTEFKKALMDKMSTAPTGNPAGKMEPIFKTLTDQIKSLQINQNVHDQFSRALITCYQSIMIEMAADLRNTQTRQEERLSKLEAEMNKMKTTDWVSQLTSGMVYVLSLCLSVSVVVYLQIFRGIKAFVGHVLELEHGIYILAAIFSTAAFMIVTLVRSQARRRKKQVPLPDASSPRRLPARRHSSDFPIIPEHPSVRLPRSMSLQCFPSE